MLQEHQVILQARERENEFLRSQRHSEPQLHVVSFRRLLHEREVQQEQVSQSIQNMEHKEAQLRVQLQTEEFVMKSMKEGFQETSESSLPYTSADAHPRQPCYLGHTAPLTPFSCGGQVPDVDIPHYRDARMQHSQSRQTSTPWCNDRSRAQRSASIY